MSCRACLSRKLEGVGMRSTRQRLIVGRWLWPDGQLRHVEAGQLHLSIRDAGETVSLATVYNTLRDFERAGLIRRIAVASDRIWYDTELGNHRHFHVAGEDRLFDAPETPCGPDGAPRPPEGYGVTHVDTIYHLEKVAGAVQDCSVPPLT